MTLLILGQLNDKLASVSDNLAKENMSKLIALWKVIGSGELTYGL